MPAPTRENVMIPGPVGQLEAIIEQHTDAPKYVAVVCHPHPLYQGTMHNKVVTTLARVYRDDGALVVRFNYRGVGASAGSYGGGDGEADDLLAVVAWLRERQPNLPVQLAGFSFGTYVAAQGAQTLAEQDSAAQQLLLVAPSVENFNFSGFTHVACPVVVVQGGEDDVVSAPAVAAWVAASPLRPTLLRMDSAGHFFHGLLPELAELVRISRHPR